MQHDRWLGEAVFPPDALHLVAAAFGCAETGEIPLSFLDGKNQLSLSHLARFYIHAFRNSFNIGNFHLIFPQKVVTPDITEFFNQLQRETARNAAINRK